VYDWDWNAAAAEFTRALELDPGYATAHDWYAYYLASLGHFQNAIAHITEAQRLEPVSLSISTDVGEIRRAGRVLEGPLPVWFQS
jgi:tetratricopeptide (TPR) repeat protein